MLYRLYQYVLFAIIPGLVLVSPLVFSGPYLVETEYQTLSVEQTEGLNRVYENRNYTVGDIRDGQYLVLQEFPDDFDTIRNPKLRKRLFQRIVLPLVYLENGRIENERRRLKNILSKRSPGGYSPGRTVSWRDRAFLNRLTERYGLGNVDTFHELSEKHRRQLLRRVNTIPTSLVLAQATNETGWGRSRYARKGNNLFGVRTYDDSAPGFHPRGLPDTSGFRVRKFSTLRESVRHYMLTLNTHRAYDKFRRLRAEHSTDAPLALVRGLSRYSERRREYVARLVRLIKWNDYRRFDV